MSEAVPAKPKKSVELAGTPAGNTAISTVGGSGNDLHYRGCDILHFAETCEFEETAYLLIYGKLPSRSELDYYKRRLKSLRGLPGSVKQALEALPPSAHPMGVMRTGCSVLGVCLPEKPDHSEPEARNIIDRLMSSLGSMLLYWYHFSVNGKRIDNVRDRGTHRVSYVGDQEDVRQCRLVLGCFVQPDACADRHVHPLFCHCTRDGLGSACNRAA